MNEFNLNPANERLTSLFNREGMAAVKSFASQTLPLYLRAIIENKGLLQSNPEVKLSYAQDCKDFIQVLELPDIGASFKAVTAFKPVVDLAFETEMVTKETYTRIVENLLNPAQSDEEKAALKALFRF